MRPRFLGSENNRAEEDASPARHVHGDAPPFFISYGNADFPHLVRQASEFAQALRKSRITVQELELANCDHLGASYASGDVDGVWVNAAIKFMSSQ